MIRQAASGKARVTASDIVRVSLGDCSAAVVLVLVGANAHKNPGLTALEVFGLEARILERRPARFEQKPMLWIERLCLPWTDAKESRIEGGDFIEQTCRAYIALAGCLGIVLGASD
tara:strand:- start:112 stop:459 length:348 start_codon:yes stop_codon:yes gene_type:complete